MHVGSSTERKRRKEGLEKQPDGLTAFRMFKESNGGIILLKVILFGDDLPYHVL
jgi:hypothetical protein